MRSIKWHSSSETFLPNGHHMCVSGVRQFNERKPEIHDLIWFDKKRPNVVSLNFHSWYPPLQRGEQDYRAENCAGSLSCWKFEFIFMMSLHCKSPFKILLKPADIIISPGPGYLHNNCSCLDFIKQKV